MLAGGLVVEIDGRPLNDTQSRFVSQEWSPFVRDLVASHWKWGFAAVVMREHPEFEGIPMVLDLTRVSVRMHKPVDGVAQYIFSTRDGKGRRVDMFSKGVKATTSTARASTFRFTRQDTTPFGETIIPQVIVFESSPPCMGKLRSKIMSMLEDFADQDELADTMHKTMHVMKYPQLITETVPDPGVSSGNVTMAVPAVLPGMSESIIQGVPETSASKREDRMNIMRQMFQLTGRHVPYDSSLIGTASVETLGNVDLIHMPEGRKVTSQIERKVLDGYMEIRIAHEERVGGTLGVPRAMWAQGMHRHTSSSDDNRAMFNTSQQTLKQFIQPQLSTLFMAIHGDSIFIQKATKRLMAADMQMNEAFQALHIDEKGLTSVDDIEEILTSCKVQVDVSLPGIPPYPELKELWMSGVLTYDAFRLYTSQAFCIPLRHLHEEPEIPPRDLLGLQPLETEITTTDESKGNESGTNTSTTTSQRTRVSNGDSDASARNRKRRQEEAASGQATIKKKKQKTTHK